MGDDIALGRSSSRIKRSIQRYDDADEVQRKRQLRKALRIEDPFGQKFYEQIEKQSQDRCDFSLPTSWTEGYFRAPPFRNLKQNLYRPPLCRPCFDERDVLICDCKERNRRCDMQCQNRFIYVECVPGLCPNSHNGNMPREEGDLSVSCGNNIITLQQFPRTEVFATEDRGYSLRLLDPIPAHSIVAEYMGEVITNDEMWSRMKTYKPTDDFYFADLGGGLTLDASQMGSLARFANHSCEPTCIMQRWTVKGEPRIVLTSLKDLPAGSEVTYCYNFEDDNFVNNPVKHQICRCGSVYCSGRVGKSATVNSAEVQALVDKAHDYHKGDKTATIEILEELLAQTRKYSQYSDAVRDAQQYCEIMLDTAKNWLKKVKDFNECVQIDLVDMNKVASLLEQSPPYLRSESKKQLKQMLANYEEVKKNIGRLKSDNGRRWDDLIECVRNISNAFPMNCAEEVKALLSFYLPCLKWCLQHVAPFTICLANIEQKQRQDKVNHSNLSSPFSMLKRLFGTHLKMKDSPAYFCSKDYELISTTQLNNRFSDFIFAHSNDVKNSEDEIPVCYCHTLDSAGDQIMCFQCSACHDWFHPACMNLSADTTRSLKKSDDFFCVSCSFRVGLLSSFVFLPGTEWAKVVLKTKGPTATMKTDRKAKVHTAVHLNDESTATFNLITEDDNTAQSPTNNESVDHDSNANGLSPAMHSMLVSTQQLETGLKHKHFWLREEIEAAKRGALSLPVSHNPVVSLLLLTDKFFSDWERDIKELANRELALSFSYIADIFEKKVSSGDHVMQCSNTLRRLLKLYFHFFQLRIKPGNLLKVLRVWIWSLSIAPFLWFYYGHEFPALGNTMNDENIILDRSLSVESFCKIVSAGKQLAAHLHVNRLKGQEVPLYRKEVQLILDSLEGIEKRRSTLMEKCRECKDSTTTLNLSRDLKDLKKVLRIEKDYQYVRMMSLSRSLVAPTIDQNKEEYCWCREGDIGVDMICCDHCNEWFHTSCVGLKSSTKKSICSAVFSHNWCMYGHPVEKKDAKQSLSLGKEDNFLCISCCEGQGKEYNYAW